MRRRSIRVSLLLLLLLPAAAAGAHPPRARAGSASRTTPSAALDRSLSQTLSGVGGASSAEVIDLGSGQVLFSAAADRRRMPASVEKIYTTSTALSQFGPRGILSTEILGAGRTDFHGVFRGTLYLRGGGDPTFGSAAYDRHAYGTGATIERLVANLRSATGITAIQGTIIGDAGWFDTHPGTSATGYAVSSYLEGALSGLAFDRGFADEQDSSFQSDPPLFAAQRLASALRTAGVRLLHGTQVRSGRTPGSAAVLAAVHSPSMQTLVRLTNTPSDNYLAEMLIKDLGAAVGGRGSTAAGAAVVRAQLVRRFEIHPRVVDGSGLSRQDATSPSEVITALRSLASSGPFVSSLAVAGESGTLEAGLQGTPAQGRCRGKTGTLHDVASLVGYCTSRLGRRLVFAFLENSVDPVAGHASEDRMAVALARYSG